MTKMRQKSVPLKNIRSTVCCFIFDDNWIIDVNLVAALMTWMIFSERWLMLS